MTEALRNYHQRRWVLTGAIAIIKSCGLLSRGMRQKVHELEENLRKANWETYQHEK